MKKKYVIILVAVMLALAVLVSGWLYLKFRPAPVDRAIPHKQLVDVTSLRIINKGFEDTTRPFSRLPEYLHASSEQLLWNLQEYSAGIGIRFATDSKNIGVSYDLLTDGHMYHMSDTGIKGSDLYIHEGDSVWRYVNTITPRIKEGTEKTVEGYYVGNLPSGMKEYIIYLPPYDGVTRMEVIIDSAAVITSGNPSLIRKDKKIVFYGSSLVQGASASRPGMVATNIIGRKLDCEVANLGFSGAGCAMDSTMAKALATIPDMDCLVVDPMTLRKPDGIYSLTYNFLSYFRSLRPDVPVIMVECAMHANFRHNLYERKRTLDKNAAYRRCYEDLKAENPENIYYVDAENLDGPEHEGTVDRAHLSDLGFTYYAEILSPLLRRILYPETADSK